MGFHSLLQGIFPTQGLNLGLLCCRQILYLLSHQRSPQNIYIAEEMWFQISRFGWENFQNQEKATAKWKCPAIQPHSCEVSDSLTPLLTSPLCPPYQASLAFPALSVTPRGVFMAFLGLPAFLSHGPTCTLYNFLTALSARDEEGTNLPGLEAGWSNSHQFLGALS